MAQGAGGGRGLDVDAASEGGGRSKERTCATTGTSRVAREKDVVETRNPNDTGQPGSRMIGDGRGRSGNAGLGLETGIGDK